MLRLSIPYRESKLSSSIIAQMVSVKTLNEIIYHLIRNINILILSEIEKNVVDNEYLTEKQNQSLLDINLELLNEIKARLNTYLLDLQKSVLN